MKTRRRARWSQEKYLHFYRISRSCQILGFGEIDVKFCYGGGIIRICSLEFDWKKMLWIILKYTDLNVIQ